MGWATAYIEKLKRGETVQFRPRGNSMAGKIESEQLCTVVPVRAGHLNVGDIVLCKVNGFQYFHLIKAIRAIDSRFTFAPSYGLSGQKQSWQKNDDGNKAAEFERLFSSVRFYCCS